MKPAGQAEFAPTAQRRRYDVTPAKKYAAQHALETPNPQVASQGRFLTAAAFRRQIIGADLPSGAKKARLRQLMSPILRKLK
jgi:hypothetical protein